MYCTFTLIICVALSTTVCSSDYNNCNVCFIRPIRLTVINQFANLRQFSVDPVHNFSLSCLSSAGRVAIWYHQSQVRPTSCNFCRRHPVMVSRRTLQQCCGPQNNKRRQHSALHSVLQTVYAAVSTSSLPRSSLIAIFIDLSHSEPVSLLHGTVPPDDTVPFNDFILFGEETQNPHCLGKCFTMTWSDDLKRPWMIVFKTIALAGSASTI